MFPKDIQYLNPFSELAEIHQNLGDASAVSKESALRCAYQVDTVISELEKLVEVTKQCKEWQCFSKLPNEYLAIFPKQCFLTSMTLSMIILSENSKACISLQANSFFMRFDSSKAELLDNLYHVHDNAGTGLLE